MQSKILYFPFRALGKHKWILAAYRGVYVVMRSLQPRMAISFLRISAAKRTLIAGMEPFLHKAKSSECFSPLSFFAELHRASASDRLSNTPQSLRIV